MKTISPGTTRTSREDEFPLGGGEMGALVRVWSKTSLGPISAWPSHLVLTERGLPLEDSKAYRIVRAM